MMFSSPNKALSNGGMKYYGKNLYLDHPGSLVSLVRGMLALMFVFAVSPLHALDRGQADEVYEYAIKRNGDRIGTYTFRIDERENVTNLSVKMRVEVRFLGFRVYSLFHRREDVWRDDTLIRSKGETTYKGETYGIRVSREDQDFRLVVDGERQTIDLPLKTFVPWLLEQEGKTTLLTEKGNLRHINRHFKKKERIAVDGESMPARRFLYTGDLERRAWYDRDGWLLVMKYEKDGATIRIERQLAGEQKTADMAHMGDGYP